VVTVSDDGAWQSAEASPTTGSGVSVRGRGLTLMRRLTSAAVTTGPSGTSVTLTHPLPLPGVPSARRAPDGRPSQERDARTDSIGVAAPVGSLDGLSAEEGPVNGAARGATTPLTVLLVEDDDADALLVTEHFADVDQAMGQPVVLRRVNTVGEAHAVLDTVDCVLLDLALPDAHGLDALKRVLRPDGGPAVVVLTGRHDEALGVQAVAAGAQDYLLKDTVDGSVLLRAVRYAVERSRWEGLRRELWEAKALAEENVRLERGLLPSPLLVHSGMRVAAKYEPGAARRLLGGDFYDAVEDADGTLHVVIGDVCGHGPDEAALGVNLRIAWRTMVLNGDDADGLLPTLGRLLTHERNRDAVFATLAALTIAPDRHRAWLRLAGHPPPILLAGEDGQPPRALPTSSLGRPVGIRAGDHWEALEVTLPPRWAMLLYTDGLIEGRPRDDLDGVEDSVAAAAREGEGILDTEGLLALLPTITSTGDDAGGPTPWHGDPDGMLDGVMTRVRALTHERADDVAAVLLVSDR
jgi:serine phosphatase RsbU (regulator of sigma subunit)